MLYNVEFSKTATEDWEFFKKDQKLKDRIKALLKSIKETPFSGIGKPEPLRHDLSGYWSRKINSEHRIVYKVEKGVIIVIQMRYHYKKK
ncbi:MAG: Txe/YoeB family addiction module toxin [Flavobacteriaceae bacterium]|jgi:toxin YoeB|nr:Txe/YoeB family addiction module toxin [Flavobacteriaceae bacterium]